MSGDPFGVVAPVLIIAGYAAAIAATKFAAWRKRQRLPIWRSAASHLGLEERGANRFRGKVNGFDVSFEPNGTVLVSGGPMLRGLQIFDGRDVLEYLKGQRVRTGDEEFDERFVAIGDPATVAATLGVLAREQLLRYAARAPKPGTNWMFDGEGIQWTVSGKELGRERFVRGALTFALNVRSLEGNEIVKGVEDLVREGSRLSAPDLPAALLYNVRRDPIEQVRLTNLRVLLERHLNTDACAQAVNAALHDELPSLRIVAAQALGADGKAALAAIITNEQEPDSMRAGLFPAFALAASPAEAAPVLCVALRDPSVRLRDAATTALTRVRDPGGDPSLLDALLASFAIANRLPVPAVSLSYGQALIAERQAALALRSHLGIVQAEALSRFKEDRAESALLQLLERDDEHVQRAAAKSLAAMGTVRAVEPLLAISRALFHGARDEARDAVRAIQARLGDADAGRLSLVEADDRTGALSLTEQAGALSEPPAEAESERSPAAVRERS